MKKFGLTVVICLLCIGIAYALADNYNTNTNTNTNQQQQGQVQTAIATQRQLQEQNQAAIALQGQKQLGINDQSVKIEGDETKTTAIAFPSTGATEGVASANATYMFGNLGLSDTEIYKKGAFIIQTVLAIPDSIVSQEEKKVIVKDAIVKMQKSLKQRRLLGIGPEQHSKNLINLFGLLSLDSVWADNQNPFQKKSDIGKVKIVTVKTVDEGITGNGGYVNR